jgi:di/tricarboxylate transporter
MTLHQGLCFAIILGMMALFAWDRWRYDIVALAALLAAIAGGVVPMDKAFSGFSNQLLPLIASVLVVSAAIAKTGILEIAMRGLAAHLKSPDMQVFVLCTSVAFLSALVKNVGALAMFLPIAMQMAQREGRSASFLLMPMSFASLLGGTMTLIGTSPNLIAASLRQNLLGAPYAMFDFLPVGLGITLGGLLVLTFGWRLIPLRKAQAQGQQLFRVEDYFGEARMPAESRFAGGTVAELEKLAQGEMTVEAVIRRNRRLYVSDGAWQFQAGDILVLRCDPQVLARIVAEAGLELVGGLDQEDKGSRRDDLVTVEGVVMADSLMAGSTPQALRLQERHGVNLLAVSHQGRAQVTRLGQARLQVGDVIALQGYEADIPDALTTLGLLPLAERHLALGKPRQAGLTVALLLAAVILASTEIVPAGVAFTGAAVAIAALRILTLREIYAAIEWPILVLLGALIPIGEGIHATGATDLIAASLSQASAALPPSGLLAGLMIITMIVTPFLHHAAAVIVMAPIAVSLAQKLGLHPDAFLMAVTLGASCDFLSPIGHQCNTLVMGPGGYRFTDYWRLGLPLSILVIVLGVTLIRIFWPIA